MEEDGNRNKISVHAHNQECNRKRRRGSKIKLDATRFELAVVPGAFGSTARAVVPGASGSTGPIKSDEIRIEPMDASNQSLQQLA